MNRPGRVTSAFLILLLGLAPLASGCSAVLTKGPPPDHLGRSAFDCSEIYVAPAADTTASAAGLLLGASGIATPKHSWTTPSRTTAIVLGLVTGAVFGASALYGFRNVNGCHEAKESLLLRRSFPMPGNPPASTGPVRPGL